MHRFHLPPEQCGGSLLTLTGREAHHGLRVLRIEKGESVTVLDGAGGRYLCDVAELGRDIARLQVREKEFVEPFAYRITLLQAIPKGKMFDSIVQKATELGAFRIVPLLTERVVTQLDGEKSETKTAHWHSVAVESIKQCGSTWLPKIEAPLAIKDFLAREEPFDLSLIASLQPESKHPRKWFDLLAERHQNTPKSLCVWVGPEGDFTPAEIDLIKSAGGVAMTLGPLVLRCETAATYCLSVLNYELQSTAS